MYAQKVNELPGEFQDFIQINETTGNIAIFLKSHSSDAVHVPLIAVPKPSYAKMVVYLHWRRQVLLGCGLDEWTRKMINVGYQGGRANAYAYADKSAMIQIQGSTVKAIGADDDQGNATIFCKLDAEKSKAEAGIRWKHLQVGGSMASRATVKNILIGTGAGLIVLTIIIGVVCVFIAVWHPDEQLNTALSYSHAQAAVKLAQIRRVKLPRTVQGKPSDFSLWSASRLIQNSYISAIAKLNSVSKFS
uniref:Uncharacterized protein n=1 Tax=Ditylenchus dipsaci TaxID=166011 RepID=A0A915CTM4_9BILA